MSRWEQFYREGRGIEQIRPSATAHRAASAFAELGARLVLDVGCGTGRDSMLIGSGGAHVIGVDVAIAGLAMARSRRTAGRRPLMWVAGDARALPFVDASFDGAYCFGLLHEYVGDSADEDVAHTMAEISRVLRPGGQAVVAVLAGDPGDGLPHVRLFSEALFDAAVAGFEVIEKALTDDLGCTGRSGYMVWVGRLVRH